MMLAVEPLDAALAAEPDVGEREGVAALVAEPGHLGALGAAAAVVVGAGSVGGGHSGEGCKKSIKLRTL